MGAGGGLEVYVSWVWNQQNSRSLMSCSASPSFYALVSNTAFNHVCTAGFENMRSCLDMFQSHGEQPDVCAFDRNLGSRTMEACRLGFGCIWQNVAANHGVNQAII